MFRVHLRILLTLASIGFLACSGVAPGSKPSFELVRVIEIAGRQGVATDGEAYFASSSTSLFRYSKTGQLLAENAKALSDLPLKANHIGDISVHEGELYAAIEFFEDGRGQDIQIAVYDARTLTYLRSMPWAPESGQVEVSAIAVDASQDAIWLTDWVSGHYVYRYGLSSGRYRGRLHLRAPPQWQQGIAVFDGDLYITADDGDAEYGEVDNLWRVPADRESTAAYVAHAHAFREFPRAGEIEGLCFDAAANEMIVLSNRGKRIVLGMPKGLYPGYDREIHELHVYRIRGTQPKH